MSLCGQTARHEGSDGKKYCPSHASAMKQQGVTISLLTNFRGSNTCAFEIDDGGAPVVAEPVLPPEGVDGAEAEVEAAAD